MPKVHLSGMHMASRSYYLQPFPINICVLSEQVTFHLQPRKQLHTLTPINTNFTILSTVTYIFILIGSYEVTFCSSMVPSMGTPKLVTKQTLRKVIICPNRYLLTRCSVFATHLYFWKQSFDELPE